MSRTADFYIKVEEDLEAELGRRPTDLEIIEAAQDRLEREHAAAENQVLCAMEAPP